MSTTAVFPSMIEIPLMFHTTYLSQVLFFLPVLHCHVLKLLGQCGNLLFECTDFAVMILLVLHLLVVGVHFDPPVPVLS